MPPQPCTLVLLGPLPPGPQAGLEPLARRFGALLLGVDEPERQLALGLAAVTPLGPPPLGGIVAALALTQDGHLLVVEHAAALSSLALLERLATHADDADVVLAERGRLVPGRYRRSCARPLERALRDGRLDSAAALRGLKVAVS